MQDTSPGAGADCLQEERASVLLLKELFFPLFLFFLPSLSFLLYCECATLRSDPRRVPERQLSSFSLLLEAVTAAGRCLLVETGGGAKSRFQLCYVLPLLSPSPRSQIQTDHKSMLDLKKKIGGGNSGRKKNETAYPMENFKGQAPFLCSFVYFSCGFFFPFWRVREQEKKVTENIQTMKNIRSWENSPEERGKRGFKIKERQL